MNKFAFTEELKIQQMDMFQWKNFSGQRVCPPGEIFLLECSLHTDCRLIGGSLLDFAAFVRQSIATTGLML